MGIIIKDGVIYGNNEPHPEFIEVMPNAGFHNSIFRGKYLGASFTEAQSNAIKAGTFDDLFVGDYWTINGINWRIADFDPYYNSGNTKLATHHIVIIPESSMYGSTRWNSSNDTSSGYVNSPIRQNIKAASASTAGAEEKIIAAFGSSHVLNYRAYYPSAYTNGVATSGAWVDARVELMSEIEVYGAQVWSNGGYEVGASKRQFSIFRLAPSYANNSTSWWLRDVVSASTVSLVYGNGMANFSPSASSYYVRPFALIA